MEPVKDKRTPMFYMGHGEPVAGHAILDFQASYIHHFLVTLRAAVERDGLDFPLPTRLK
jgi:hypothetical protein